MKSIFEILKIFYNINIFNINSYEIRLNILTIFDKVIISLSSCNLTWHEKSLVCTISINKLYI